MKKIAASYCHVVSTISDWVGKGTSMLLIVLVGILTYEVILRYAFNNPTRWAHESSTFLFGAIGMLSGAYVLLHKGHVNLDMLYARVSPRKQAILDLITAPLFFFIMALMIWAGGNVALRSWKILEHSSTVWGPPIYPFKTLIPVAAGLLILQGIVKLIHDLFFAIRGKELE